MHCWFCLMFSWLVRSDSLRLAGGVLQAQALPSVWPLHEIPGEAYSFILALCQYYGIMHELRLPKSVRPDAPPFSSNAMAEAMVVPYFLAPKSSGLGSGLLSRAIGTDSLMYQRRYELQRCVLLCLFVYFFPFFSFSSHSHSSLVFPRPSGLNFCTICSM